MRIPPFSAVLILTSLLVGCATTGPLSWQSPSPNPSAWHSPPHTPEVVAKVLETGRSLVGQRSEARVVVNGRSFTLDCVGTVSAAWWGAGIDVQKDFRKYRGDAVNRLYSSLKSWGALHWHETPVPGDLIIWDHTWDFGSDPNFPDGHSHAGLVLSVSADGTIEYLHESVTRGVVVAYMNLYDPGTSLTKSGRVVNSPMFMGSNFGKKNNPPRWTSGQLWSAFGDGSAVARVLEGS